MKTIQLTQGYSTLVDDEDYEKIIPYRWYACINRNNVYAGKGSGHKTMKMHRLIMNITDKNIFIDHRDGNGLNNQKSNLRTCNRSQNSANKKKISLINRTSKYLGVGKRGNSWGAFLRKGNQRFQITSKTEIEAAKAYNEMAQLHHGEFAKLNVFD